VGALAIGAFDEGVLQAFLPNAILSGIGPGAGAVALAFQSLAYVVGQVLGGWLSDRLGRRAVGIGSAVVILIGVVAAIGLAPIAPALAVAGIVAHGLGTGATIAVRSAAFHDVFSGPSFGTIFGLLSVAYPLGGTVAVYVGAIGADRVGSYLPVIPVVVVAVATWSVALWVAGPRRRVAGRRPAAPMA
jgi:MFS family permease